MKSLKLLAGTLAASTLGACQKDKPLIFSSSDELHMLAVEPNGRFSLMNNGFNTWHGTCRLSKDTLYLTYDADQLLAPADDTPPISVNQLLVRTIIIDRTTKRVRGLEGQQFCGFVGVDKL